MRVGIVGGTFDPIHNGHIMLGQEAYFAWNLDEIWFLPNGNPPHKETKGFQSKLYQRVEMIQIAIENIPHFQVSLLEAKEGVHSYTYKTLEELQTTFPAYDFYFIMGADSLFTIEKWMQFREIFPRCMILAAFRDDKRLLEMKTQINYLKESYEAKIELLFTPIIEVSSSGIRQAVAVGEDVSSMLPEGVWNYIREQQLYTDVKDRRHT